MSSKILTPGKSVAQTYIALNNGKKMPIIGFGTYRIVQTYDHQIENILDVVLAAGYRAIDTAQEYRNEHSIGEALQKLLPKHGLKREDIFLTTKLSPQLNGLANQVKSSVEESLKNLKTSYIDLFLIHWPGTFGLDTQDPKQITNRFALWDALVELYDPINGPLKAIGVSNYTTKHLNELIKIKKVVPAVNQVEFHPHFLQPSELVNFCHEHKIILQAYASLGSTSNNLLIKDSTLEQVAKQWGVSPAQVLLRWALQENFIIIPKSITSERIKQNIALDFELSPEQMLAIRNIPNKTKYCWNPEKIL